MTLVFATGSLLLLTPYEARCVLCKNTQTFNALHYVKIPQKSSKFIVFSALNFIRGFLKNGLNSLKLDFLKPGSATQKKCSVFSIMKNICKRCCQKKLGRVQSLEEHP